MKATGRVLSRCVMTGSHEEGRQKLQAVVGGVCEMAAAADLSGLALVAPLSSLAKAFPMQW